MAKKKDHLPARQPKPDAPALPNKKAKRLPLPRSASNYPPPEESEQTEFDVILDTLDSKDYRLTDSLLRTYLNIFACLRKAIAGISNTPQGKRVLGHRLELEKKRDEARNEQLLARAEIDRAIARRIATADTVEIEEILDASAKGHAGLSRDETGGQVGIGGAGQRVVKRRIVLKGTATDGQADDQGDPPAVEADASRSSRVGKASLPHSRGEPTEETEKSHDKSAS
jgi:hypothetical protein